MVEAIIGIIGTLLGTILGWILNNISQRGKLHFSLVSWEDSFKKNNKMGEMVPCDNRDDTELYSYSFSLDIYNSSSDTLFMRDIRIAFCNGKKDIQYEVPKDDETRRLSGPMAFYDDLQPVNISPKSIIQLHLHGGAWNKDHKIDFIWNTEKIYLVYKNNKNKEKWVLLKTEKYGDYFINHTPKSKE